MKKILSILLMVLLIAFMTACGLEEEGQAAVEPEETEVVEAETETDADEETDVVEEEETEPEEPADPAEQEADDVPREYQNALRAAENYISFMPFSEKGLFEQLTSEYGDKYPEEAAQYAIENIEVDYNEQALKSAISYLEMMPMSDQELLEQLTSEYGEQFTNEQAQYAIDNLPN
ncbi:Ltp family lipoprotein [Alkalihalobacillus sp. LMS39]|uniref:Ltp family lipoprotein n=1 Tax=Alkalihalobacillus sp. LMS39 TaxID=2924032 RepID=UPI001FB53537|nr:Ltp family lipoprotein [Alkalihalobacillus sp. LMS39]UOE93107.1 Ltp family lipoprotein [Alkalihalobacillus sp. LMS39]